ncbi:histidine-specific methyltransferase [Aspergillus cavernicola]|uniref:Histidine-specific methyltransferase n=1 Tax=Aspergillus cavernicola TaxID=176166 RepID=A0ABR4HF70_9EURO
MSMTTSCQQVEEQPPGPISIPITFVASSVPKVYDIRRSTELLDLKSSVVSGLTSTLKTMPSLLLWDEQGLKNFDAWTQSPHYYPKERELEIITCHRHAIARALPEKSVLIELGCGSLGKTAAILAALANEGRRVEYYALDVSEVALVQSLGKMREQFTNFAHLGFSGLIGTYEDCAEWLVRSAILPVHTVTFLWVGNSVANLPQSEASLLMGQFRQACQAIQADCHFLVAADGCAVEDQWLKAYDPTDGPSRTFLLHGLHHANRLLGHPTFDEEHWSCVLEPDRAQNELHFSYVPKMDVTLDLGSTSVLVRQNEKIHYFMSGKWNESQMQAIAEDAGYRVSHVWEDARKEYGFYLLQG